MTLLKLYLRFSRVAMTLTVAHEGHITRFRSIKTLAVKKARSGCQIKTIRVLNENGFTVKSDAEYPYIHRYPIKMEGKNDGEKS